MIETTENQTSDEQRSGWGWPLVLAITLALSPAVGTLGGLGASQPTSPVDAEQPQADLVGNGTERAVHDAVCTLVPATSISENCAEWVAQREGQADTASRGCGLGVACPGDLVTGPNGERVYTVATDVKSPPDVTEEFAPDGPSIGILEARDASSGALAWSAILDFPTGSDLLTQVALSPDGDRVYVAGHSWAYEGADPDKPSWDVVTAAYDAETGQRLWLDLFGGSDWPGSQQGGVDYAEDLVVGPQGQVYTFVNAGYLDPGRDEGPPTDPTDAAVVAYEPGTGERTWTRLFQQGLCEHSDAFSGGAPDACNADMEVSPSGDDLILVGASGWNDEGGSGTLAYQAVLLSTADGGIQWTREIVSGVSKYAAAVAVDGEHVYVETVGTKLQALSLQDGDTIWNAEETVPRHGQSNPATLVLDPDRGRLFAYAEESVRAYDAQNGTVLWEKSVDRPTSFGAEMTLSPDGGTLLHLGTSYWFGFVLEALDSATGESRWSTSYNEEPLSREGQIDGSPLVGGIDVGPTGELVYIFGLVDRNEYGFVENPVDFTTFASEIAGPTYGPELGT